ncbi:MAG: hypothetical protein RIB97_13215 [Nitratireductor sp.]
MTILPPDIEAERLERMGRSKRIWLKDHGPKRPAHESEYERENLEALISAWRRAKREMEREGED